MRSQFSGRSLRISQKEGYIHGRRPLSISNAIKKSKSRSIVCCKTIKVKDDKQEEATKLCTNITEWVHKEMQDRSQGIEAFEVYRDSVENNQIHFWERYADNELMGLFNSTDKFQKFMFDIQDCLEEPIGLVLYDWRNGELGPSAVQGGPKGEGGLDDATGAGGKGPSTRAKAPRKLKTVEDDSMDAEEEKKAEEEEEEAESNWFDEFKATLSSIKFPWE